MNVNQSSSILPAACAAVALALALVTPATAEEGHDHGKRIAGPHGGRVLTAVEPHLEFLVTKERKVQITAVDGEGKAVPLGEQSVQVTGGRRSQPTKLSFTREGDSLVSSNSLPEGNGFPVVVQIKSAPDAKAVFEKFNLNLHDCPTCDHAEYACTCVHADEEGHAKP